MKKRLNITIDPKLINKGKRIAKKRKVSLSELIERFLVELDNPSSDKKHWSVDFRNKYKVDNIKITDDEITTALKERSK